MSGHKLTTDEIVHDYANVQDWRYDKRSEEFYAWLAEYRRSVLDEAADLVNEISERDGILEPGVESLDAHMIRKLAMKENDEQV